MKEPTMPPVTYGLAKTDELPRLREIFLQCFGEAATAEMELVFLRYGNALWCARKEGIPAAMLVAMPVTLAIPEGEVPARYFYGVATHPDFRRQGLCSGLLEHCCRTMAECGGQAVLLRPDSEKNRRFYAQNGFIDCSKVMTGNYTATGEKALACTPAKPEQYDTLRRKFAPWGLQWGVEGLTTQRDWLRLYNGELWLLGTQAQPMGCAAVSREGEAPLVRELLCRKEQDLTALEGLCRTLGAEMLRLALPEPFTVPMEGAATEPMMMVRKTGNIELPQTIYTPLAMD